MNRETTRRRLLAGIAGGAMVGLGGCVTLSPSVSASLDGSAVFESVETSEPWATQRVRATVTLADGATTDRNVRAVVVVAESGSSYLRTPVESGQTSVTTYLPLGQTVTLAAVDNTGKTVETVEASTK